MCEYSIATMDYLPRLGQHLSASLHCRVDGFLIYQSLLLTALSISVLHDGKRRAETSISKSQFRHATSSTWHRYRCSALSYSSRENNTATPSRPRILCRRVRSARGSHDSTALYISEETSEGSRQGCFQ